MIPMGHPRLAARNVGSVCAILLSMYLFRIGGARARSSYANYKRALRALAPKLTPQLHKGQAGRVGVLGGSKDYTGAPYYAGAAALECGADLYVRQPRPRRRPQPAPSQAARAIASR